MKGKKEREKGRGSQTTQQYLHTIHFPTIRHSISVHQSPSITMYQPPPLVENPGFAPDFCL